MATTYEPIATTTLSSAAATVEFTSISGSYTDLVLVIDTAMSSSGATVYIRVNSDSGSNYSTTTLYGNGTSALSARLSNSTNGMMVGTYDGFSTERLNAICHFMNYANTTTYKSMVNRFNQSNKSTDANVSLWRSTSAITTILVRNNSSQTFASGSTFTLYGIKAA